MDITALSKITASLLLIIGVLLAGAWLMRRLSGTTPASRTQAITIISAKRLGSRHSIALIEVANARLLIGVSPGGLDLLHTLEKPDTHRSSKAESAGPPIRNPVRRSKRHPATGTIPSQ